jgi:hypothetical protein
MSDLSEGLIVTVTIIVVAKVRERLAASKRMVKMDVERFYLKR